MIPENTIELPETYGASIHTGTIEFAVSTACTESVASSNNISPESAFIVVF